MFYERNNAEKIGQNPLVCAGRSRVRETGGREAVRLLGIVKQ